MWGTEFVVIAAVFIAGVVTGAICDLILVYDRGVIGAAYDYYVRISYVNMGFVACLELYPLAASSPSTAVWTIYIRVSSTSNRLFLLVR